MPSPERTRSVDGARYAASECSALVEFAAPVVLSLDRRSREERALKLAGYSDDQIRKLLVRSEAAIRRAA